MDSEVLAREMLELDRLWQEYTNARTALYPTDSDIREQLRKWLDKVKEIAQDSQVESYTVTLGFPLAASVSFTFKGPQVAAVSSSTSSASGR
jgi:hypothetical protein